MNLKNLLFEILANKTYRNVTHGTSKENALKIQKNGFKLPNRKALFFDSKGLSGKLHQVYGSDALIIVDLFPKKSIDMKLVRSKIFQEMKSSGIKINEVSVHQYLNKNGYDLIDNENELIVLDPNIIKIKDLKFKKEV